MPRRPRTGSSRAERARARNGCEEVVGAEPNTDFVVLVALRREDDTGNPAVAGRERSGTDAVAVEPGRFRSRR